MSDTDWGEILGDQKSILEKRVRRLMEVLKGAGHDETATEIPEGTIISKKVKTTPSGVKSRTATSDETAKLELQDFLEELKDRLDEKE